MNNVLSYLHIQVYEYNRAGPSCNKEKATVYYITTRAHYNLKIPVMFSSILDYNGIIKPWAYWALNLPWFQSVFAKYVFHCVKWKNESNLGIYRQQGEGNVTEFKEIICWNVGGYTLITKMCISISSDFCNVFHFPQYLWIYWLKLYYYY